MTLHVDLQRLAPPSPPVITLSNGEKYRVRVLRGADDVTELADWRSLAKEVSDAYIRSSSNKFKTATLELTGDFNETLADPTKPRQVSVHSAVFTSEEGTSAAFDHTAPLFAEAPVQQALVEIASTFGKIKPVSSPASDPIIPPVPATPAAKDSSSPAAPVRKEPEMVDPRFEICKNRKVVTLSPPTADTALAHQLKNMLPRGTVDYSKKEIPAIAQGIRQEVAAHIKRNETKWIEGEKFKSIFEALNQAQTQDNDALGKAIKTSNPFYATIVGDSYIPNDIAALLGKEISTLTTGDKTKLLKVYRHYVRTEGKILNAAFFTAFVEKHQELKDQFQVVVIGPTTHHYIPKGDTAIDALRCAFIKYDATTKTYHSYQRGLDKADPHIVDLNTFNAIGLGPLPLHIDRRQPIEPAIQIETINDSGRCLDMAIAYQLLPNEKRTKKQTEMLADQLRSGVSDYLKQHDALDDDEQLFTYLCSAIRYIPGFSEKIDSTLLTKDFSKTTPEERKALRLYYADYITQDNNKTYLDLAFLYILPSVKIKLDPSSADEINVRCAVIQGNRIYVRFPHNTPFEFAETIFINYNGVNHFDAAAPSSTRKIEQMIKLEQEGCLDHLYTLIASNPEKAKEYLLSTVQFLYPAAYKALKGLIYVAHTEAWNEHMRIENMPDVQAPPGTVSMQLGTEEIPAFEYGHWALHMTPADQLAQLLSSHAMNRAALNEKLKTL